MQSRAGKLLALASSGAYTTPKQCQIHVGALDWQSVPDVVVEFGKYPGLDVTVVPNAGHMLGRICVGEVLDNWLLKWQEDAMWDFATHDELI